MRRTIIDLKSEHIPVLSQISVPQQSPLAVKIAAISTSRPQIELSWDETESILDQLDITSPAQRSLHQCLNMAFQD